MQMDGSSDNILIAKLLEMASTHPFLPLVLVAGGFTDEIVAGAGQVGTQPLLGKSATSAGVT